MTTLEINTQAIHTEIEKMTIIDAHEHLYPKSECLKLEADALTLFRHYIPGDLRASGMKEDKVCFIRFAHHGTLAGI